MSLFGALASGVSGLSAQSSALGAIGDNVSNVNTIGYKSTDVQFKTLITKQVSSSKYSPGGVQAAPKTGVDVQGLLQSTTSSTDIAISGAGFFVVNEQPEAGSGSLFAYTRAGSYSVDKDGFLRNTAGWYLQGWPLQPAGNSTTGFATVTIGSDTFVKAYEDGTGTTVSINDNIVSPSDLQPLNLNTIGGTAQETTAIRLGANLPATDAIGVDHKTNVVINDTLGNSANLEMIFVKGQENSWDISLETPANAATIELHGSDNTDTTPDVYAASGLITFTKLPTDGETIIIDGITFEFDTNASVVQTPTTRQVDISATTVVAGSDVTPLLKTAIDASGIKETSRFASSGSDMKITQSTMGASISVDVSNILSVKQVAANGNLGVYTIEAVDYAFKNGARMDFINAHVTASSLNPFVITDPGAETITAAAGTFSAFSATDSVIITSAEDTGATGNRVVAAIASVNADGSVITFANGTLLSTNASDTTMSIMKSYDTDTIVITTGTNTTQTFELRAGSTSPQANGTNTFTTGAGTATITAIDAGTFYGFQPGDSITLSNSSDDATYVIAAGGVSANGKVITLTTNTTVGDAADTNMTLTLVEPTATNYVTIPAGSNGASIATALKTEIDTVTGISTPTRFSADGSSLIFEQSSIGDAVVFNIATVSEISTIYAIPSTATEGTAAASTNFTVSTSSYGAKKAAIDFAGDGLPSGFNVNNIDIQWANGSTDQEFTSTLDDKRISVFLGDAGINNGMTQFAGNYQINFITQNGAQFGNFAGVSVGGDGVVTALFDNGVTRPVFMLPVATFVNANAMESLSGNVYIETDVSGSPTVREAGEGGAGQLSGATLESSTVDLGEEFTQMIITQRAYSAAAKIITTADEMLDELLRIKR